MKAFYWAIGKLTSLPHGDIPSDYRPAYWRGWLAAVAVLQGLAYLLIAWIIRQLLPATVPSAILSTAAILWLEAHLRRGRFSSCNAVIAQLLQGHFFAGKTDVPHQATLELAAFLLKPVLIFTLCAIRFTVWFPLATMLSACILLDMTGAFQERQNRAALGSAFAHWGIAFLCGCLLPLCCHSIPFLQLLMMQALAMALPAAIQKYLPNGQLPSHPLAASCCITISEWTILLLGVLTAPY